MLKNVADQGQRLAEARPTAVNLGWGVRKIQAVIRDAADGGKSPAEIKELAIAQARKIQESNISATYKIGEVGRSLIKDGDVLVTVCNAGTLAADGIGTSTAPMRAAWTQGVKFRVLVTYTAPLYQGARLTAWELAKDGIPAQVITDNMAGHLMREEKATAIWAGADRILGNRGKESGTVYNKIGTFGLALMAKALRDEKVPVQMYVAAPTSTIDPVSAVADVKIEQRMSAEVEKLFGAIRIVPEGIGVLNPAFDRTPPNLVSAIVTELGLAIPPYDVTLPEILAKEGSMAKLSEGSDEEKRRRR
jgi:methylthioribose-1-phosphate isomerase